MISSKGLRHVCPRCTFLLSSSSRQGAPFSRLESRQSIPHIVHSTRAVATRRNFASTARLCQGLPTEDPKSASESHGDIEQVVRDAKQRFRDTLPKGFLNEEEYRLYERLYGPPLRETTPEDVGIPEHADMGAPPTRPANEGTVLKEVEGGSFEELRYHIMQATREATEGQEGAAELPLGGDLQELSLKAPDYIEAVARNDREREALQALQRDFEAARKKQLEEQKAREEEEEKEQAAEEAVEGEASSTWGPELLPETRTRETGEGHRFHPFTIAGRYAGNPVEVLLPRDELVLPVSELLKRTDSHHVRAAAEDLYGGSGLATSPATPDYRKNGNMGPVGLAPDAAHMTEIEADAFLAAYIPPAYASVLSILTEVRRRVGSEWLQRRLRKGKDRELSVLDAGTGGAALLAWDQILQAEWEVLLEKGQVRGERPASKKSVVAGSDRLRQRTKTFLHNTSFLPRLPDYEHSGEMQGEHLEAGDNPLKRKKFDIVIASHLFLKEKTGFARQALLNNLWTMVKPDGGILVVQEKAHPRGFEAMAHVRDTILNQFLKPQSGHPVIDPVSGPAAEDAKLEDGRVLAPCTTQGTCPMYTVAGKSTGRKDFCHFNSRFVRPTFYSQMFPNSRHNQGEVEFSYVAVQRGVSSQSTLSAKDAVKQAQAGYEDAVVEPDMQTLPRVLLPPLKRKGHVVLDVCTPEGKAERWTVPRSFSHLAYHDARKSRWGDLWALGTKTRVPRSIRLGMGMDIEGRVAEKKFKDRLKPRSAQRQKAKLHARTMMPEMSIGEAAEIVEQNRSGARNKIRSKAAKTQDEMQQLREMEKLEEDEFEAELAEEEEEEERRSRRS